MATLAVASAIVAVVSLGLSAHDAAHGGAMPACREPVEVESSTGARLGCAEEPGLGDCGALAAGDRVLLRDGACRRAAHGMRGGWRLLSGLPLLVNRASAEELELLHGIGPAIAAAIVEERRRHGPFESVEALQRVRGIGPATVERLRAVVAVDAPD